MNTSSIAKRYARALFELADEEGRSQQLVDELARTHAALSDPELTQLLDSPVVSREEKVRLADLLVKEAGLGALLANTLRLLAERDRLSMLPAVERYCRELADEKAGLLRAQVTSASPLSDELARALAERLTRATGRNVLLERAVDPALLGGVVAQVGGKVYDGSLKSQLEELKKHLKA